MSDNKAQSPQVADFYDDLYVLGGAVLDKDSYEKHKEAESPACPETGMPATGDPFAAPQDLGQMAAQAFEADRQAEYRPETASFVVYTTEEGEYIDTTETYCPGEMRIVLGAPCMVRRGSGSYRTAGSYRMSSGSYRTSGSYRLLSGSYRISSGSYRTSGSYRMSSGSYRISSGSYRTSGSYRMSSGSYRMPGSGRTSSGLDFSRMATAADDQPYMGSLYWNCEAGGYGLNLI